MRMAEGHLIYTLDDPYIHLSLAYRILHGGFGINAEEFSSPSSSILYPLVLAPTIAVGLGTIGPLLINSVAAGLSVWLLVEFVWRRIATTSTGERWFVHLLCPFAVLSINPYGLPMTGMEHSLHVLTVIVTMREMAVVADRRPPSRWLYAALFCMPFLRFEGLALAGTALLVLFWRGQRRAATVVSLSIVLGLAIDAVVMRHLGLPFLPSSVLLKSKSAADVSGGLGIMGILKGLAMNLVTALHHSWGIVFTAVLCLVVARTRSLSNDLKTRELQTISAILVLAGLGAHLAAGQYGWFHRYEVYAVAILVMGLVGLFGADLFKIRLLEMRLGKLAVLTVSALLVEPYAEAAIMTPAASRNVYEQQFQMHRFAADFYPHRVAVNDLGWVSFQSRSFVLDLWGLGSEPVRRIRAARPLGQSDLESLTASADVDFAMIYGAWFVDAIPGSWCLMATLHTEQVTSAEADVLFFATKPSAQNPIRDALQAFAPTLPTRVTLTTTTSCPG